MFLQLTTENKEPCYFIVIDFVCFILDIEGIQGKFQYKIWVLK